MTESTPSIHKAALKAPDTEIGKPMKMLVALGFAMLASTAIGSAGASGPTNIPDPASLKDGQLVELQLLTEPICVNGHFAGLAAPSIAIVPPSLRPPVDHGAPGYRIFSSCPEAICEPLSGTPRRIAFHPNAAQAHNSMMQVAVSVPMATIAWGSPC